jgi:hypothetical protein
MHCLVILEITELEQLLELLSKNTNNIERLLKDQE